MHMKEGQAVMLLPFAWALTILVLYAAFSSRPLDKVPITEQNITSPYHESDDVLYCLSETEVSEDRWVEKIAESFPFNGTVNVFALIAESVIATDCKAGIFGIL